MTKASKKKNTSNERIATEEEVRAAYEALTDAELLRLFGYAEARSRKLGKRGLSSGGNFTGEAMVKEALIRTLACQKKWKLDSVPFIAHMFQAVKNISGHAREHLSSSEAEFEVQATQEIAFEDQLDPLMQVIDDRNDPEEAFLEKEQNEYAESFLSELEKEIMNHKDHKLVSDVLGGWRANMSGVEIREALDINQTQYETIQRYLLRTIEKIAKEGVKNE